MNRREFALNGRATVHCDPSARLSAWCLSWQTAWAVCVSSTVSARTESFSHSKTAKHTHACSATASYSLLAALLLLGARWVWGLLTSSLTFAIRRFFLLLSASGDGDAIISNRSRLFLIVGILWLLWLSTAVDGCSHEDVGVGLLQLAEHFLPMLGLQETAREQFYWLKDLLLEFRVSDDRNGPL